MLRFCPYCANILMLSRVPVDCHSDDWPHIGNMRFECRTCPYQFIITEDYKYKEKIQFERKVVDEVIGVQCRTASEMRDMEAAQEGMVFDHWSHRVA